jgi:hypothetical protein
MRIAIIGSRFIENKDWIYQLVDKAVETGENIDPTSRTPAPVSLVSGGSEGVNSFVHEWAKDNGYDSYMFKPHFMLDSRAEYSPRDFFTRYRQIIDNSDSVIVVVLKQKEEPDVLFAIEYANKKGKKPLVLFYDMT